MNRLTERAGGIVFCPLSDTTECLHTEDGTCCCECEHGLKVWEKLAAYEDIGLEPEEVAELAKTELGRWNPYGMHPDGGAVEWECSACERRNLQDANYCPNCGAKMEDA